MRPQRRSQVRFVGLTALVLLWALSAALPSAAQTRTDGDVIKVVVAVLPFEVNSAKPLGYLETSLADLLVSRLEASGRVEVLESVTVRQSIVAWSGERTETMVRQLAAELGADYVVAGSLTELAGRYSMDVRVTPVESEIPTRTMVFTAENDDELLDRVNELADRILGLVGEGTPQANVALVLIEGVPEDVAEELRQGLRLRSGVTYESAIAREDVAALRAQPRIATASVATERTPEGVVVIYRLVPTERLLPSPETAGPQDLIADVQVRGNRRIEANAIRARLATRAGEPYNPTVVAGDVREVYSLGFFRNVRVLTEDSIDGRVVVFEVEENPVVRQVSIAGNESVDGDKIRDSLTLTTGSTLDYPLLFENRERIEALYRAEGYYLAQVRYEIEDIGAEAVSIHFEVDEKEKLKLEQIEFVGNEHFSDGDLRNGLKTRERKWYSLLTSWLDKSGTYSEPVFVQDLQHVTERYLNEGFLRVEVGEPDVRVVDKDGKERLTVQVNVIEGDQYDVGTVEVAGDETIDLEALREQLDLDEGAVFNRSFLTDDVEKLERYYTDRGFFYATVSPRTDLHEDTLTVDVVFQVEKGDLHFIREIDISGNTNTLDTVIRREMKLVERQLYAARAVNVSRQRIRSLGFFEDVEFEANQTDYPDQLDLDVKVVERPTGSLSFGAGFSTQDRFVVSGSLSQNNLFGRGYGASISLDIGGASRRFFMTFFNPYLFGSEWSMSANIFSTDLEFEGFAEQRTGVDFSFGHDLSHDARNRLFLRYNYSSREIERLFTENASSVVLRELLSTNNTTSLIGVSFLSDTRDDRVSPTSGHVYGANLEYAGLGGFSKFLRLEGRAVWFRKMPDWIPRWWPGRDDTTLVFGLRAGWTLPFNEVTDYEFTVSEFPSNPDSSSEVQNLRDIDSDLRLPLGERYFLGGLGIYQLRGYRARTVGPRRALLQSTGVLPGLLNRFTTVGRLSGFINDQGAPDAVCVDEPGVFPNTQGNGNGRCNSLFDQDIDDFDDLEETDVVGGNKFLSGTFEYRFPISEQLGLIGILFLDVGNAFAENENIFDLGKWRYGTGFGVQWFSPFGPLQAFVGFPLNKLEVEDPVVFEFSVGGQAF